MVVPKITRRISWIAAPTNYITRNNIATYQI